jgi:hypothetical protein
MGNPEWQQASSWMVVPSTTMTNERWTFVRQLIAGLPSSGWAAPVCFISSSRFSR